MAPQNTEQSFRANLSQFRWARDQQQQQQQEPQGSGAGGAFGRFYSSIGISDYVPLRSNERSNEDEAYFALSRWERCVQSIQVDVAKVIRIFGENNTPYTYWCRRLIDLILCLGY